jgi:phospholipase/carboxylesterase
MSPSLETVEIETGRTPTASIIWLHGLGADGNDFVPMVDELDLGPVGAVRFVFPHAPIRPVTINQGYRMRAWYDILSLELDRREDEAGIHESARAIEQLIEREVLRGSPRQRIVLAGFSQGCAMALHVGLRQADPLAGVVGLSGYLPLAASLPAERATRLPPLFLAHGTADPVVTLERAQRSYDTLKALHIPYQWYTYPMPHSVHPQEVRDIATFLRRVLV